jgi:hypothetical protein
MSGPAAPIWSLDRFDARLNAGAIDARLDLLCPRKGMVLRSGSSTVESFDAAIHQVDLPDVGAEAADAIDAYVRAGDLVATYAERAGRALRAQVYWRARQYAEGCLASVEVQVSVQTSLLENDPALFASSRLLAAEWLYLADDGDGNSRCLPLGQPSEFSAASRADRGCWLARLNDKLSYCEVVHPLDFRSSHLSCQPTGSGTAQSVLRHRLFAETLEKGVILRARVLGVLLPRDEDVQTAREHWRAFARSEPPLTT